MTQLPGDVLRGEEGHGTIKFLGSFPTFSWTVPTPEFWHGFTFGIRSSASDSGAHVIDLAVGEVETADFGNINEGPNYNPEITTPAPTNVVAGDVLLYRARATDLDGDTLTFDLPVRPGGMTVHPTQGVVAWTPGAEDIGEQAVILRVRDGRGGVALQSFSVTVAAKNTAPSITSTPPGPASPDLA